MTHLLKSNDRTSLAALVLANLVPLVGVVFAGWDVGMIVLLYWAENLVIGFYTILRMAMARVDAPHRKQGKAFIIPFFCVHYGGFCAGHGFFVLMLVSMGRQGVEGEPAFGVLPAMFKHAILPLMALAASHGVSFVQNYVMRKEYVSTTIMREMGRPYARIVLLHVAILVAATPVTLFGSPWPLVVLLVAGKIVLDLILHARSHRPKAEDKPNTAPESA